MYVKRIGLDLAKNVFELYGVDEHEQRVPSKGVRRGEWLETFAQLPPCVVEMKACRGAHDWARELRELGHEPRLLAPQFVAPYRNNDKNDCNVAAAICEAAGCSNMRFVPIRELEQQVVLTLHRARSLLVSERTALVHHMRRGPLREYGLVMVQGVAKVRARRPEILEDADNGLQGLRGKSSPTSMRGCAWARSASARTTVASASWRARASRPSA